VWAMANEILPGLATFGQRSKTESGILPLVERYLLARPDTLSLKTALVPEADLIAGLGSKLTKGVL